MSGPEGGGRDLHGPVCDRSWGGDGVDSVLIGCLTSAVSGMELREHQGLHSQQLGFLLPHSSPVPA